MPVVDPLPWPGWQGREIFVAEATVIIRHAMPEDKTVFCKGSASKNAGLIYPIFEPEPINQEVLPALLARTVEMRSRRWNKEHRLLGRWPELWEDLIRAAYPQWTCGFACTEGWADLIAATAGWIAELQPDADWRVSDVKEKWGLLRISYHGDLSLQAEHILGAAEDLSEHICEVCGAPGSLRQGNWLTVLCSEHDADRSWREWVR
jgi:hypothetical protein